MPQKAQSDASQSNTLDGIRGWLLLFSILTILAAGLHIAWAIAMRGAAHIEDPAFSSYARKLTYLFVTSGLIGLAMFGFLFRRNPATPAIIQIGIVLLVILQVAYALLPRIVGVDAPRSASVYGINAVRAVATGALWFMYFKRSRRVQQTYGGQ